MIKTFLVILRRKKIQIIMIAIKKQNLKNHQALPSSKVVIFSLVEFPLLPENNPVSSLFCPELDLGTITSTSSSVWSGSSEDDGGGFAKLIAFAFGFSFVLSAIQCKTCLIILIFLKEWTNLIGDVNR